MSKYWMNKQDDISLEWWNTLKYEIRNKLSMKYFDKNEPISLFEIKEIWLKEKDN
jgi:hypothetical protein